MGRMNAQIAEARARMTPVDTAKKAEDSKMIQPSSTRVTPSPGRQILLDLRGEAGSVSKRQPGNIPMARCFQSPKRRSTGWKRAEQERENRHSFPQLRR